MKNKDKTPQDKDLKTLPARTFKREDEQPLTEEEKPTKKDYFAMWLSAMLTIFLPIVGGLALMAIIVLAMFGAL